MTNLTTRIIVEIVLLIIGVFVIFMPYVFGNMFASSNVKISISEEDISLEEKQKRAAQAVWRGSWMFFVIIGLVLIRDLLLLIEKLMN